MEVSGKIKLIGELQKFDSGFTKREFVVTTPGEYPQDISFTMTKNHEVLKAYKVGQEVTVHFNLRGREFNGKYYNDLQCWKIEEGFEKNKSNIPVDQKDPVDEDSLPF